MVELSPDVEAQLAALSESEWSALSAKLRAPDNEERFREIACTILPSTTVELWASALDFSKFTDDEGRLDEQRVLDHLAIFHGAPSKQWGDQ
jgi:hypothetical protein